MERRDSVFFDMANPYSNPDGVRESKPTKRGKFKEPATNENIDQILTAIERAEKKEDRSKRTITDQLRDVILKARIPELRTFDTHAHQSGFTIPKDATIHEVLDRYPSL